MADSIDRSYAETFFKQALHDLRDADVLAANARHSAAVVSSQHAVEKALKAVLYLRLGRLRYARPSHFVIADIENELHSFATYKLGKTLKDKIVQMEELAPSRDVQRRNTEYPYFPSPTATKLEVPGDAFGRGGPRASWTQQGEQ